MPAMLGVAFLRAFLVRVGPALDTALADSAECRIEQVVVGHEGVVLLDLHRRFGELQQHTVVELHVGEGAPGGSLREFEQLAEEAGRLVAVCGGR